MNLELAAWLEGLSLAPLEDADVVAGRFLRHCRRPAAALRRARSLRLERTLSPERADLVIALQSLAETGLVRRSALAEAKGAFAELWRRAHVVAGNDLDAAHVVVARLAAEAIDDACGELFAEMFRRRGRWLLAPGEPYPPVVPDLASIFVRPLITHTFPLDDY